MTPADLKLMMIASLANEWEAADEGHAEFIFTNLSGAVEAAYVHGVSVTRTETLKWLAALPLATEPDPDPEPETHDRP
jgi:hypothetical protein